MDHLDTLVEYLDAEPFVPFRITMVGGRIVDVKHPDHFGVRLDSLSVYASPSNGSSQPRKWEKLPLERIDSISPLHTTMTSH